MNPAFAQLARKKAVLIAVVDHLTTVYTSAYGAAPKVLSADELPRDQAEISEEQVQETITDIQQDIEHLKLEMKKFDFVRKDQNEPKGSQGNGRSSQARGAQGGRGRQGSRR